MARFVSYAVIIYRMLDELERAMVTAVTLEVHNEAKRRTRGGFKGGAFVTNGWTTITWTVTKERNHWVGRVGTPLMHFLYWELGHHNLFTGRYERVEWLRPAVMEGRVRKAAVALRAAQQVAAKYRAISAVVSATARRQVLSGLSAGALVGGPGVLP